MPARWMEQKRNKQRRERRAWARPLSVKSGIVPNRQVIQQYQATAKGLGMEEARTRFPNVAPGKYEINERIEEILSQFNDPLFICILENAVQRVRVFFNSKKTCFIFQQVSWKTREVRISITYPSMERAEQVYAQGKVCWKAKKSLPVPVQ